MAELRSDFAGVDWNDLAALIEAAGLGQRDPALLERVFRGSYATVLAYEDGRLVGAGRAISDGVTSSAIYDLVVAPDRQGRGLGKALMQDLLARLPARSVMLLSVPREQGFYAKLGFRRLKTAMLKHEQAQYWIDGGYMD